MNTAYLITKPWLGTVEIADRSFGQSMLAKFLGQVAAAEPKPSAICFYTEGVKAALADAPFREPLDALERAGVPLLLCGTCIEHYGVAAQVVVGSIADMKAIATALGSADKVVTV